MRSLRLASHLMACAWTAGAVLGLVWLPSCAVACLFFALPWWLLALAAGR